MTISIAIVYDVNSAITTITTIYTKNNITTIKLAVFTIFLKCSQLYKLIYVCLCLYSKYTHKITFLKIIKYLRCCKFLLDKIMFSVI